MENKIIDYKVADISLAELGRKEILLAEKEIRRIENLNESIAKFKPLIKLYDRADIINDIA